MLPAMAAAFIIRCMWFTRQVMPHRYLKEYQACVQKREDLRALFTRRIGIAQADYLHELEENKRKLSESRAAEESLFAELAEIEKKKQKSLPMKTRSPSTGKKGTDSDWSTARVS